MSCWSTTNAHWIWHYQKGREMVGREVEGEWEREWKGEAQGPCGNDTEHLQDICGHLVGVHDADLCNLVGLLTVHRHHLLTYNNHRYKGRNHQWTQVVTDRFRWKKPTKVNFLHNSGSVHIWTFEIQGYLKKKLKTICPMYTWVIFVHKLFLFWLIFIITIESKQYFIDHN